VRQHVRPANLVTSLSICAGFLALVATSSQLALATALVLLAALLDVVDGALARRAGGDHTFGAQLDSLADLLCFCVVPALALHHVSSAQLSAAGVLAGTCVVLAGAWRLSRFPLVQEQGHFIGLPTPAAGVTIMLLVLGTPSGTALFGAVVLSLLMVSSIRFPSVLAAAASVRPGDRAHALRRQIVRGPPALVPRALARARRPRGRRPATGQPRRGGRAGQVLGTLRRGGARRHDRA
jgi:CDP-diacylglycerol---serine O-phosphatidyltransferase